jgi:integrase
MFLFDSGVRSPTELFNIKISDFSSDFKELNVRQEISKTFGRRIKLMISPELLKEYVTLNNLDKDDFLFEINHSVTNRYLKRVALRVFGDNPSPAGAKYSELTMYDLRHNSCCYWLPRYKSESALKYRFGWKKSEEIHYYSELLGMRDTIQEDDMLIDITKTEIEKKLEKSERDKEILISRLETMEMQMKQVLELTNQLGMKI